MLVPAFAEAGPVLTTAKSAIDVTVVTAVELLLPGLGSALLPVMVAVLLRDDPTKFELTFAVSVKVALAPEAKLEIVQVTLPLLPTPGLLQMAAGPVFCTSEANVVP